jgi:hypothetical protein
VTGASRAITRLAERRCPETNFALTGLLGMNATTRKIAELLHEAGETHHVVYRIVDGDDPDWASWYADWLIELSELPELLGARPVRSHLVYELVSLDREYTSAGPDERWEDWYAERLLERLGSAA